MDIISIIVTLFGILLVGFSLASLIKRRIRFGAFLLWFTIGLTMLLIGLLPFEISELLKSIGVTLPFNALVIISFVVIIFIILLMWKRILKIEEKIIKIVQQEGLRHFKENNKELKKDDRDVS